MNADDEVETVLTNAAENSLGPADLPYWLNAAAFTLALIAAAAFFLAPPLWILALLNRKKASNNSAVRS